MLAPQLAATRRVCREALATALTRSEMRRYSTLRTGLLKIEVGEAVLSSPVAGVLSGSRVCMWNRAVAVRALLHDEPVRRQRALHAPAGQHLKQTVAGDLAIQDAGHRDIGCRDAGLDGRGLRDSQTTLTLDLAFGRSPDQEIARRRVLAAKAGVLIDEALVLPGAEGPVREAGTFLDGPSRFGGRIRWQSVAARSRSWWMSQLDETRCTSGSSPKGSTLKRAFRFPVARADIAQSRNSSKWTANQEAAPCWSPALSRPWANEPTRTVRRSHMRASALATAVGGFSWITASAWSRTPWHQSRTVSMASRSVVVLVISGGG